MSAHGPGLRDYPFTGEPPQPSRKRWYRRWPAWIGIGVIAVVITALIASLAGGGGSTPAAQPTSAPSISLPPAPVSPPTEEPPTTEPSSPLVQLPATTLKVGETAHVTDDSYEWTGTFDMAVVRPLAVVKRDNGDRILAFAVKVSNVQEDAESQQLGYSATFKVSDSLYVTPSLNSDNVNAGAGDSSLANAPSRTACGTYRPLDDVTQDAAKPVTGCVWFYLSPGEKPDTISYSSDSEPSDVRAWWSFTMPSKAAPPVFEGLTYTVTSDGGISSVTYGTANFNQAQDTNVQGSTWSKSLPQGAEPRYPVVVAQAGEGATTISCKIAVGGEVKTEQTSHGQYAVVTCSAQ